MRRIAPELRRSCAAQRAPLPHCGEEGDGHVLDGARRGEFAHQLEVALDEVGVAALAQPVVVQVVVLDVPRLRQHPVEPVARAPPRAADGEARRREAPAAADAPVVLPVVAAVADVVADHRPPRARPRAQRDDRQQPRERAAHPHRRHADERARVRPRQHLLEVAHVGLALPVLEALAQRVHLRAERRVVERGGPRVGAHRRRRTGRHHRADVERRGGGDGGARQPRRRRARAEVDRQREERGEKHRRCSRVDLPWRPPTV